MRARLFAFLTATLLLLALVVAAPGAFAAPSSADPAAAGMSVRNTTAAERAAATDYWTPSRMGAAVPGEMLVADRDAHVGSSVATGRPRVVDPSPADHKPGHGGKPDKPGKPGGGGGGSDDPTVTGATWTSGGTVAATTGKVFFTLGGTNYVCSGSSVASTHGNLVLTAGHCLHEGPGAFATNFVFVPAYNGNGSSIEGPYGVWTATSLATTSQWASSGNLNYDVGFARVTRPGGQTLTQVVGAQGIGFNQPTGAHVYAFGYPAASPYNGRTLIYCAGNTTADPYGRSTQGVVCNMTGGSSGGPWYSGFNATTGVGTAYSVNSYRYISGPHSNKMFGPYFGSAIQTLYNAVR